MPFKNELFYKLLPWCKKVWQMARIPWGRECLHSFGPWGVAQHMRACTEEDIGQRLAPHPFCSFLSRRETRGSVLKGTWRLRVGCAECTLRLSPGSHLHILSVGHLLLRSPLQPPALKAWFKLSCPFPGLCLLLFLVLPIVHDLSFPEGLIWLFFCSYHALPTALADISRLKSNLSFITKATINKYAKVSLEHSFGYIQCRHSQLELVFLEIIICIALRSLLFTFWYNFSASSRSFNWSQLLDWWNSFRPPQCTNSW